MNVQLFTEADILDYLMTSEFTEGLTQEESKFLLLKYRNFYRVISAKNERLKDIIENMTKDIQTKDLEIKSNVSEIETIKNQLLEEENRKLTYRERFLGKKSKKNESK